MLLTGQDFSQLRASLEMPCMTKETYQNFHKNLSAVIKEVSWQKMKVAEEEEAALAIQAGDVDNNGIPVTAVVTNGACSRRSYATNYNILSGVAIRHF
ncbi:hypothetical protein PR048_016334 [Dryococelus australis]|uniref:Mutator-like transposase domain-containing protein n=1 Tax=Dryococelus australis TaxID=614101 RepID=A0ABQ9HJG0_9NEOP|nr:hypothetical protein PR048_016334 [Dryococelus australis]